MIEAAGLAIFVALVGVAALSDVRTYRIPNILCLALVALLLLVRVGQWHFEGLPMMAAAGGAALAVGFVGFAFRLWGGGDAKLLAAVCFWTGFAGMPRLLLVTAIAGGVFALAMLAVRAVRRKGSLQIPYGVAIAVGAIDWALPRLLLKFL